MSARLSTVPLRLFLAVAPDLAPHEFRPLKQTYLAHHLGITQQCASLALGALVHDGFLEVGPSIGSARSYRPNMHDAGVRWVFR